jgi:hypothetical protein
MRTVFFIILAVCLQSCTSGVEDVQQAIQQDTQHTIRISNEGKPFEYWLYQAHYNSDGQEVEVSVNSGTQITMSAIVPVVNGVSIPPNFTVRQDGSVVQIKQVTSAFYWYQVI